MNAKDRKRLLDLFLERRKNLMEPVVDIIWDLTKDIEPRAAFRASVNHLFRSDYPGKESSINVNTAISRIHKSKTDPEGYEYILSIEHHLTKIVNQKF